MPKKEKTIFVNGFYSNSGTRILALTDKGRIFEIIGSSTWRGNWKELPPIKQLEDKEEYAKD